MLNTTIAAIGRVNNPIATSSAATNSANAAHQAKNRRCWKAELGRPLHQLLRHAECTVVPEFSQAVTERQEQAG